MVHEAAPAQSLNDPPQLQCIVSLRVVAHYTTICAVDKGVLGCGMLKGEHLATSPTLILLGLARERYL